MKSSICIMENVLLCLRSLCILESFTILFFLFFCAVSQIASRFNSIGPLTQRNAYVVRTHAVREMLIGLVKGTTENEWGQHQKEKNPEVRTRRMSSHRSDSSRWSIIFDRSVHNEKALSHVSCHSRSDPSFLVTRTKSAFTTWNKGAGQQHIAQIFREKKMDFFTVLPPRNRPREKAPHDRFSSELSSFRARKNIALIGCGRSQPSRRLGLSLLSAWPFGQTNWWPDCMASRSIYPEGL